MDVVGYIHYVIAKKRSATTNFEYYDMYVQTKHENNLRVPVFLGSKEDKLGPLQPYAATKVPVTFQFSPSRGGVFKVNLRLLGWLRVVVSGKRCLPLRIIEKRNVVQEL